MWTLSHDQWLRSLEKEKRSFKIKDGKCYFDFSKKGSRFHKLLLDELEVDSRWDHRTGPCNGGLWAPQREQEQGSSQETGHVRSTWFSSLKDWSDKNVVDFAYMSTRQWSSGFIDKIKNKTLSDGWWWWWWRDLERRSCSILLGILLHDLGEDGSSYFQMIECWDE